MFLLYHYLFGIVANRAETKAAAILLLLLFLTRGNGPSLQFTNIWSGP